MYRSLLIIFLSLTLSACSDDKTPDPPPTVDELRPHVERFDNHYDGDWPERFEVFLEVIDDCDDDSCVAGYCLTDIDGGGIFREVAIDIDTWAELTEIRREALIFHELGHCVMDLDHTEPDVISFMSPSLMTSDWYAENRDEIYIDLFGILPLDPMLLIDSPHPEKYYKQ